MFDSLDEAGLLEVLRDRQRAERVAIAERLLAAGRYCLARFEADEEEDRGQWYLDSEELVAAELGAHLGISRGRAGYLMYRGVALIERFPKLAAVFAAGEVDYRIIIAVIFRTGLIRDEQVLAIVDENLARLAPQWNATSSEKINHLIDLWVRQLDPAAERLAREHAENRSIGIYVEANSLANIYGKLHAADGAALDAKLDQLADTVCPNDQRTKDQRRADALGALAAGASVLACDCGGADCTQTQSGRGNGVQVVINVIAPADTISGTGQGPALLPGHGPISAATTRALAGHATVRTLLAPHDFTTEPGYRPSVGLAEFIRCRDLHCRFPGCTRPAVRADIDHTVPWPSGPTHPSNLKILCRAHHIVKTFATGWTDRQFPDGTIEWTSPTGRTYTTKPGGALFFPQLSCPSAELVIPETKDGPKPGRLLAMPQRHQPRAEQRANRIQWLRNHNQARLTQLGQPIPTPEQTIAAYLKPF
jgi:hypothetical protein